MVAVEVVWWVWVALEASVLWRRTTGIRLGAILRSGEDEWLGLALNLSADWLQRELMPPSAFYPKMQRPRVVVLGSGERSAYSVMRAVCWLAGEGVSGLVVAPDAGLEEAVGPLAEGLRLPLLSAARRSRPVQDRYFTANLFSTQRYLESLFDFLQFWRWDDFLYIYSRQQGTYLL